MNRALREGHRELKVALKPRLSQEVSAQAARLAEVYFIEAASYYHRRQAVQG